MNKFGNKTQTIYSRTFAFCESFNKKYEILDKIGSGQSSNVFLVKNKLNNQHYALKAFNHLTLQGTIKLRV
jgi:serine/threonine protein kinase